MADDLDAPPARRRRPGRRHRARVQEPAGQHRRLRRAAVEPARLRPPSASRSSPPRSRGSVERLRRSIDELLRLLRMEDAMAHEARTPVRRRRPSCASWPTNTRATRATPAGASTSTIDARAPRRCHTRSIAPASTEMLRNLADNALVQPAAERRHRLRARPRRRRARRSPSATTAPASRARTRRASSAVSSRSARRAPPRGPASASRLSTASRARTAAASRSSPSPARARSSASFFRSDRRRAARLPQVCHNLSPADSRLVQRRSPPSTTVVLGGCP